MSEYKIYWGNGFEEHDGDYQDWVKMQEAYAHTHEMESPRSIRYLHEDEDGVVDVELTRENSGVETNYCNDDADCWWVQDPRDQNFWVHFRFESEDDARFNTICKAISNVAIPPSWVREVFMNRIEADLSVADDYPQAWDFEVPKDGTA